MAMVQYGLWPNCTNNCDFCLLLDRVYKSEKERLRVLAAVKENIKAVDWKDKFSDGISLLGGEIFYTDSEKVKASFLDLINVIIDCIFTQSERSIISIVSNGIYDIFVIYNNSVKNLVPNIDEFVSNIDIENKRIYINSIEGLLNED